MNHHLEKMWGLLVYKAQWTLSGRGWFVMLLLAFTLIVLFVTQIQSFLAVSAPIEADALVVEGWIADEAIEGAIAEFERGNYQLLIVTGLPIAKGSYLIQYQNFAELSAATLLALGFDPDKIVVVPAPKVLLNRTSASAIALREWLVNTDGRIKAINLYSWGLHTRRSWLLFQRALAPEIRVGAIAYQGTDWDSQPWWTYSEGVKSVICEVIGYLYAQLIR